MSMTEDPWEVLAAGIGPSPSHHTYDRAHAALTTLREQAERQSRQYDRMKAGHEEILHDLYARIERQEAALDRIARMDTGITADAPLSEAPSIARRALSTGEPSSSGSSSDTENRSRPS